MFRTVTLLPLLLLFGTCAPLCAERYAILAGVGDYKGGIRPLEGPAEDISVLRQMLLEQQYAPDNITVLLNSAATKRNILAALDSTVARLKSGDHLFFYFSGHGTSAFDRNSREISPAIGPDSGGLLPFDLSLTSIPAVVDSLLIGRRDLRPILARVPPQAQAFVVLDSCYSENSAKAVGLWSAATPRSVRVADLIKADSGKPPAPAQASVAQIASDEPYPYSNVVSLAAAAKTQTAMDITSALLQQGVHTVDNKPHGALTNSLLLALRGRADTNQDGIISYDELFRFVRRDMERYPHQPQLLTPLSFPLDQPVLGAGLSGIRQQTTPDPVYETPDKIRVKLETPDPQLQARLRTIANVQLSTDPYDLLIRAENGEWKIYDRSSTLLQVIRLREPDKVAAGVGAYGVLSHLRDWSNPGQHFNVKLDVEPEHAPGYDRFRTTFRINERATFRIATEKPAYLLLLDINKDGRISVLFPGPDEKERAVQPANHPVEFAVPVTAPAGADQLKLIGFIDRPADWDSWACSAKGCPEFDANDPRMMKLMSMLNVNSATAEASLRVITQE
jgi:Caspase domain/Domain of unknown function (DUF4384)